MSRRPSGNTGSPRGQGPRFGRSTRKRMVVTGIVTALLLGSAAFLVLYNYTDVLFRPPADVGSDPSPGDWTMFRRDLSHSGGTSGGASPQGSVKWTFQTGDAIHSSPAVVDGTVYFGSRDSILYAVDAETGQKLWEFETGSWVDSSPVVADGVVYFGSNDGYLYAVDADSGKERWRFHAEQGARSSPAVAGGTVYFGANDDHVYAVDAATGHKLWDAETDGDVLSSPAVANGVVHIGSMDYSFYCFDAAAGQLRLRIKSQQPIRSSPAVSGEVVYFNSGGYLYAFEGSARNWPAEHALTNWWAQLYIQGLAPSPPSPSGFLWRLQLDDPKTASESSPAVHDGFVFTSIGNTLYRINPAWIDPARFAELGTPAAILDYIRSLPGYWELSVEEAIVSSPALAEDTVYVAGTDGHVYALNAENGQRLWELAIGAQVTSSPGLSGGTLYIGSGDGNLYAIE